MGNTIVIFCYPDEKGYLVNWNTIIDIDLATVEYRHLSDWQIWDICSSVTGGGGGKANYFQILGYLVAVLDDRKIQVTRIFTKFSNDKKSANPRYERERERERGLSGNRVLSSMSRLSHI